MVLHDEGSKVAKPHTFFQSKNNPNVGVAATPCSRTTIEPTPNAKLTDLPARLCRREFLEHRHEHPARRWVCGGVPTALIEGEGEGVVQPGSCAGPVARAEIACRRELVEGGSWLAVGLLVG